MAFPIISTEVIPTNNAVLQDVKIGENGDVKWSSPALGVQINVVMDGMTDDEKKQAIVYAQNVQLQFEAQFGQAKIDDPSLFDFTNDQKDAVANNPEKMMELMASVMGKVKDMDMERMINDMQSLQNGENNNFMRTVSNLMKNSIDQVAAKDGNVTID